MRKKFFRILCGFLTITLLFTGCRRSEKTGAGYLFTAALSGNPECLDPQFSDNPNAGMVISNIMEGLMRIQADGTLTEGEAESYEVSEDGLTYMFNLRKGLYWYQDGMEKEDAIPLTALDYVFAFQRIFDPETRSPYAEDFSCLKNGKAILSGAAEFPELGVSAPDKETVIFELDTPDPEFLYLLAQPCAVPCNAAFFESTMGRYGLEPETILCNGPFCLDKWNYDRYGSDNFLTFYQNITYYDRQAVCPSSLTFTILKSREEADKNFTEGDSDVLLTDLWHREFGNSKYMVQSGYAETLGLIFNPENEVLQNEKFRQALICGIDRRQSEKEAREDLTAAYGIIPPGITLLGRSYRELSAEESLAQEYAPELASELFREGMAETGMTGTSSLKILVSNEIGNTDALMAVCQGWQDIFDSYIGIETVTPSEFENRIASGDYSIALYSISGNRNSCREVLDSFRENAALLGFSSEEYDTRMAEISGTEKQSDAVELYGKAEKAILDTGCFVPLFYKKRYLVYTSSNKDVYGDLFAGTVLFREAKHFG